MMKQHSLCRLKARFDWHTADGTALVSNKKCYWLKKQDKSKPQVAHRSEPESHFCGQRSQTVMLIDVCFVMHVMQEPQGEQI